MEKYIGRYNRAYYKIFRVEEDGEEVEVYQAGNSPLDSQIYLPARAGINLRTMRKFCISTTKQQGGEYCGVVREEEDIEDL